ncbi:MAG TPA: M28 family peptidase, partial [Polyangiaceae bacterium]|nr:M28 family peptidase [Polyangiaceae bacterium]
MPKPTPRRRTSMLRILLMLSAALLMCPLYAKQPMCSPPPKPSTADVSSARLRSDVEALVALSPRDVNHPAGNHAAALFVRDAFVAAGLAPELETFTSDGEEFANVVARVGPKDGPRVVVGAHYDACGARPGADDNASGVAALLELARLFAADPPTGSVELVAFANEEPPHFGRDSMGSVHHAEKLANEHVDVRAMLCLEMVGYFDDAPDSQT